MINNVLKGFEYKGEFLDKNDLVDLLEFKGDNFENLEDLRDYFNDDDMLDYITELSDSKVDIYNYNLRQWSVDNYNYIEDAVEEFGLDPKNFDFHKLIMMGQYYAYSQEFYTLRDEFASYLNDCKYKIYGWIGKVALYEDEFDSFEEAWAFVYENVEDVDNAYDDIYVELNTI